MCGPTGLVGVDMRVTKEQTSAAAVGPAFGHQFNSELPSETELANAANDPLRSPLTDNEKDPALATALQKNSVALAQAVQVIAANRGLSGF